MSCTGSFKRAWKVIGEPAGVPADMATLLDGACTPAAKAVIRRLQDEGHQAVVVGGAVRDALARLSPHDSDVATSATPDEVRAVFGEAAYAVGDGERHGTVLVALPGEQPVETTTYRSDVATDGRRATVAYTRSLVEDLARRDLTANALAFDPEAGLLYGPGPEGDPAGALDDLRRGVIRFVGDGCRRIREDRLRALRAVRFAVKLSGELDETAVDAIAWAVKTGLLPGPLSAERVRDELLKTLDLPGGVRGMRAWQDLGLMRAFLPEVAACAGQAQNIHHGDGVDVLEHLFCAAEAAGPPAGGRLDPAGMRLAMLLHDIGKPPTAQFREGYGFSFIGHEKVGAEMAGAICRRLRLDRRTRQAIELVVREHMAVPEPGASDKAIRRWARRVGAENIELLLAVRAADWGAAGRGKAAEAHRAVERVHQVLAEAEQAGGGAAALAVNGDGIMKVLGLKPGPEVGRALRYLAGLVDDDPARNDREALLEAAAAWWNRIE
jgi:putative nucleotidyltransferase with HDIG domain